MPDWSDILEMLGRNWKIVVGAIGLFFTAVGGLYKLATDLEGYVEKRIEKALESRDAVVELQQQNTGQTLAINENLMHERAQLENQIRDLQDELADVRNEMDNDRAQRDREKDRMERRMTQAEMAESRCLERVEKQSRHIDKLEAQVEDVTSDLKTAKSQLADFLDVTTDEIELDEGGDGHV
jgi:chromosome segregation ATPase